MEPTYIDRAVLSLAALLGLTAVILAALASHALPQRMDATSLDLVKTGLAIQQWHALAAIGAWLLARHQVRFARPAGACFLLGTLLFCTAVYWRAFLGTSLGGVAPTGGFTLMAGWLLLAIGAWKKSS